MALAEFKKRGAETVDTDALARAQARKGGAAYRAIVRAFGRGILRADGEIDRAKLGGIVFSSPAARRRLERLTHPPILTEVKRRAALARGVLIVDVPLLFEGRHERRFDATIQVSAPLASRLARVARRDGITRAQALARSRAQLPDARREARADVVVRNDGTQSEFRRTIAAYAAGLKLLQKGEQTVPK